MKKMILFAAVVFASAAIVSCDKKTEDNSANSKIDSLSFAIGCEQAQQVKQRLAMMEIDTAYMDAFIKGLRDGANAVDDKKKQAYNAGVAFGLDLMFSHKGLSRRIFSNDSTKTLSMKQMLEGYISGLKGKANILTPEKINEMAMSIRAKEFEKNKEAGAKFLEENAKKAGVKKLKSGVQYKVIKEGNGAIPTDSSYVKLHYEGRTIDGKVFDSSYERKEPVTVQPSQYIKGFADALVHMPVGSVWEVYIPADLAYGEREAGEIAPYSTLIFKIEVLAIEKSAPKPQMPANIKQK